MYPRVQAATRRERGKYTTDANVVFIDETLPENWHTLNRFVFSIYSRTIVFHTELQRNRKVVKGSRKMRARRRRASEIKIKGNVIFIERYAWTLIAGAKSRGPRFMRGRRTYTGVSIIKSCVITRGHPSPTFEQTERS